MAVPKKKRYKQVMTSRSTLQMSSLISKHGILENKFLNYISLDNNLNNVNCVLCRNMGFINTQNVCKKCLSYVLSPSYHSNVWFDHMHADLAELGFMDSMHIMFAKMPIPKEMFKRSWWGVFKSHFWAAIFPSAGYMEPRTTFKQKLEKFWGVVKIIITIFKDH